MIDHTLLADTVEAIYMWIDNVPVVRGDHSNVWNFASEREFEQTVGPFIAEIVEQLEAKNYGTAAYNLVAMPYYEMIHYAARLDGLLFDYMAGSDIRQVPSGEVAFRLVNEQYPVDPTLILFRNLLSLREWKADPRFRPARWFVDACRVDQQQQFTSDALNKAARRGNHIIRQRHGVGMPEYCVDDALDYQHWSRFHQAWRDKLRGEESTE